MPEFEYRAKDSSGKTVRGTIQAESTRAAAGQLRDMGYWVLSLRERSSSRPAAGVVPRRLFLSWLFGGVSLGVKAAFYEQFATLVNAGLSLSEALTSLAGNAGNSRLRRIAREAAEWVQAGGRLSDCFVRHPSAFSRIEVALLRAGETGGMLGKSLSDVADYMRAAYELEQQRRMKTLYPKILLAAAVVIPPIPSLILNGFMAYARAVLSILVPLGALILALRVIKLAMNVPSVGDALEKVIRSTPGMGKVYRLSYQGRFYRALASLWRAGVPISVALEAAGQASGSVLLGKAVRDVIPQINAGTSLHEALARKNVLPRMTIEMLATGDRTGNMDGMLEKAAEYTEMEARVAVNAQTLYLSVGLFLIVAAYIAYRVIAFYAGFYSDLMREM